MTDLRTIEREAIRAFVQSAADDGYLSGRVLDYGCGKQPYGDIVETAVGEYGYDRELPGQRRRHDRRYRGQPARALGRDLCTQVVQYDRRCPSRLSLNLVSPRTVAK